MPEKKSKTYGFREDVLEVLLKLLAPYDDITRDNMFGFPSFRASGQIFACVYQKGISLKMPKAAAETMVQSPGISPFVPFGRARMRHWIHIERKKPSMLSKDFPLIEASMHYVRTLKAGGPKKSKPAARTPASAAKKSAAKPLKASSARPASADPPKKAPVKSAPAKTAKKAADAKKKTAPKPAKKKASKPAATPSKPASKTKAKKKAPRKTAPKASKAKAAKATKTARKSSAKSAKKSSRR